MTLKTLPVVLLAFAAGVTMASAEQQPSYTIEDVTACSQDAMRICRDKLPDLDAIESCMKANYDRLRPACKARFDKDR